MLFLAVSCGFLAEYKLEHTIEHNREKQYARTLYEDLQADTAALRAALVDNSFSQAKIDTFRQLVHLKAINQVPPGTWYYFGRFGTRVSNVALQEATLQQLLSSGGLRYFKRLNVVDGIANYCQSVRIMKEIVNFQVALLNDLTNARNKIFDAYYLDEIMDFDIAQEKIDSFKRQSFPLLTSKRNDFIQYANLCQAKHSGQKVLQYKMNEALNSAAKLIVLLKKEYRLE
ncbi:hypothetical protein OI18_12545 [Flavihumibacter solisilvae]|uniref:Uncharacterized protein n=2 Tax=Flavihumibacter solisilvae TaxID=1349421 RepID=A0A0C1LGG5_9BACT|nr:hypothetical protein OI18_12545 [Flavihumibacter solisilvae]